MKITVFKRTDKIVEFSVDDGPRQTLPISMWEKAKNKGQPLEIAIAQELGLDMNEAFVAESAEVDAPRVSLSDVKDMFAAIEHEHPVTEHPHNFADRQHYHSEISQLASALSRAQVDIQDCNAGITRLQRDMRLHDHDVPQHSHPSIAAEVDAIKSDFSMLANREAPQHEHGDLATIQQVADALGQLNRAVMELRDWVRSRDDEIREAIPEIPNIPAPGLSESEVRQLFKQLESERLFKANAVLLSTQEVGGKARYVLEEL